MEKCIWELKCVWVRQRAALRLIKRAEGRECSEEKPSLVRDWGNDGKKDLVYPPSLHPLLPFPRYWAGVRVPAQCVYVCARVPAEAFTALGSCDCISFTGAQTPIYWQIPYVQQKPQPTGSSHIKSSQAVLGKLLWGWFHTRALGLEVSSFGLKWKCFFGASELA